MVKRLLPGLTVVTAGAAGLVMAAPGHAAVAPGHAIAVRPAGGTVTLVSVSSSGRSANDESVASGISAHGRFVAFVSRGSNLVPRDTNGSLDVFVRDRLTGITTRESVSSRGAQGNGESSGGALSADGRVATFASGASNLVKGDTNGVVDVFARDRVRGVTERVSIATNGRQASGGGERIAISANGRFVAFESDAANLVRGDTGGHFDVFVRDRKRRVTERVSVATNGRQGNGESGFPSISSDGRYVAFDSDASNLVRGDTNRQRDAFVRDRLKKVTVRVSLSSAGHQYTRTESSLPSISGNGSYVAFLVTDVRDGTIGTPVIVVRDRLRKVTRKVPAPSPSYISWEFVSISQDGRYVGFNDLRSNMYVWDQWRNVTRRLPSAGNSYPLLSADGHHATFSSPSPGGSRQFSSAYAWDDVSDTLFGRAFR